MSRNISSPLRGGAAEKCAGATPKLKPCFRRDVSDRGNADGDRAGTAPRKTQEPAMDRRHLLAGLAGLPFATAAFAQTAQPQSPAAQTGGAAGGVYGAAGVTSGTQAGQGLGQPEQQWLQQTNGGQRRAADERDRAAESRGRGREAVREVRGRRAEWLGRGAALDAGAGRHRLA